MLGKLGKRPNPSGSKLSASPSKKIKTDVTPSPGPSPRWRQWQSKATTKREVPDSDAEDEDSTLDAPIEEQEQETGLEKAMPPIKTDKEAIKEYEDLRAGEGEQLPELEERLGQRKWTRGKSSIYVDAFNLALETVLDEESHLFDAAETKVFEEWRGLQYEAQYL